ncbi:MAG: hypothetical protein WDO18_10765 [Acidobacteriota bacterium]
MTDVDALVASMAKTGATTGNSVAAVATCAGILANTVLKLVLAVTLGDPAFKKVAGAGLLLWVEAPLYRSPCSKVRMVTHNGHRRPYLVTPQVSVAASPSLLQKVHPPRSKWNVMHLQPRLAFSNC